jgi:hypothetical protein
MSNGKKPERKIYRMLNSLSANSKHQDTMTITAPADIQAAQNKNDNTPIRFVLMMVETNVVTDDVQALC